MEAPGWRGLLRGSAAFLKYSPEPGLGRSRWRGWRRPWPCRGLEESELAPPAAELAELAARQSRAVAGLAAVLEQALG